MASERLMFKELFKEAVNTGGQKAGKLEMKSLEYKDAIGFINKRIVIDNFKINFAVAKNLIEYGVMKRKEMPVITSRDVEKFKLHMEQSNISFKNNTSSLKKLKPIQGQLYFDKSMRDIIKNGSTGTEKFLTSKTFFIVSNDNHIVDGHHRYLQGLLVNPDMKVQVLKIDLPVKELVKFAKDFGISIGNAQNK